MNIFHINLHKERIILKILNSLISIGEVRSTRFVPDFNPDTMYLVSTHLYLVYSNPASDTILCVYIHVHCISCRFRSQPWHHVSSFHSYGPLYLVHSYSTTDTQVLLEEKEIVSYDNKIILHFR